MLKELSSYKPLTCSDRDRLGFGGIAHTLAIAFAKNDLSQGLVIGVEGAWGSGKTSLVNLALVKLQSVPPEKIKGNQKNPEVIRFSPWLVGSRDELLEQLFADLEPAILQLVPEPMINDIKTMIGRYAYVPSALAKLAGYCASVGVPLAGAFEKPLEYIGQFAMEISKKSLGKLKRDLQKNLEKLTAPVLVFVDDLDRLDPCEVVEVLRLVKSVADFPNVAYILAYDPEVIADNINCALRISDGKSYLEKVVQASFKVPNAMNFDLRNWLRDEISLLLEGRSLDPSTREHLDRVCHQWGREYLKTPRDVVRVVNSMKLHFVPVQDKVDPGDMVFLQIVRLKNSKLFGWIERYVSDLSEFSDWGRIPAENRERLENELRIIISPKKNEQDAFISILARLHFPTLSNVLETFIYSASDVNSFTARKRLASANHFSYYFSFDRAPGTVSDSEFEQFLSNCEHAPAEAVSTFRRMIENRRPQGGRLAELLLDRITAERGNISVTQIRGLFQVLGEAIDELILHTETEPSMYLNGDVSGVFGLIAQVEGNTLRHQYIHKLFTEAKSLGWLAGIIRSSTFAHGVFGDRKESKETRLLSEEEFRTCAEIFALRMSSESPDLILKHADFLNLMYAWYQLGYPEDTRAWIKEQTKGDEEFLNVLCAMGRSHFLSDDVQYNLNPEKLEPFFPSVTGVHERFKRIVIENKVSEDKIGKAQTLLQQL